jgi:hypothetical protein
MRRRFKQTSSIEQRMVEHAQSLRDEAQGMPPGLARDQLIRRARQAETASQMRAWLMSPGLLPPK